MSACHAMSAGCFDTSPLSFGSLRGGIPASDTYMEGGLFVRHLEDH